MTRGADDDRIDAVAATDVVPDAVDRALADFWVGERLSVMASLIRTADGDFEAAEDALAEATARAVHHWRSDGVPERPGAWMLTVARRVMYDRFAHARKESREPL